MKLDFDKLNFSIQISFSLHFLARIDGTQWQFLRLVIVRVVGISQNMCWEVMMQT